MNYVYKWGTFDLFKGVQNGEVFVYDGGEYIKVNLRHVNYKPVNCYCIIKGNYDYLYDDAKVRVVKEII